VQSRNGPYSWRLTIAAITPTTTASTPPSPRRHPSTTSRRRGSKPVGLHSSVAAGERQAAGSS